MAGGKSRRKKGRESPGPAERTRENMDPIMVEEWRGLRLRVIEAANPKQIGLEGVLVDEGVSQLAIRKADGTVKRIQKAGTRLQVMDGKKMIIDAGGALMRSEDRTKRLYRKIMKQ